MGREILLFYQTKIKREYKIAFAVTFISSLLIHIYKFTNTLPNHDSLYNYYSVQNILGSGRWALSTACSISSYYDLPWINGLLSCLFLGFTVMVVTAILEIKNPIIIGLTGMLFASSLATTETFFFLFTADGYMIAMFLAAIAVWYSRMEENRVSRLLLSVVCLCISCGIYQAYISFALLLALSCFILNLLQNKHNMQQCVKWVIRQAIIYLTALISYYIIWKLCMIFSNIAATSYQGISEVGEININLLIQGMIKAFGTLRMYFFASDTWPQEFTAHNILNILFLLFMFLGLVIACVRSKVYKRKWSLVLLILCCFAIVPFACIWHFTSDSLTYHMMMLQGLTVLFVLTALLYENWSKSILQNALCILLLMIVINNALIANISYFYMNLCYERTYAEGMEMVMEIHNIEDEYEYDKIAVIGRRMDDVKWDRFDPGTGKSTPVIVNPLFDGLFETSLLYDWEHTVLFLRNTFGLVRPVATMEEMAILSDSQEVQEMECWPSDDSIKVIDNTLVIKLGD